MQFTSDEERQRAVQVYFASGRLEGQRAVFPCGRESVVVFDFAERWVEGPTPDGGRLRLSLAEVDRFDLDFRTQEGDDKTHFFYYVLLAAGERQLIFTTRQPERVWNPFPGPTRKDIVELNLGALGYLAELPVMRSCFGKVDPARAFLQEGEAKAPPSEAPDVGLAGFGCACAFLAFSLWLLWRRWPR